MKYLDRLTAGLLLLWLVLPGCTTQGKARRDAAAAYASGRAQALEEAQQRQRSVTILGQVRNRVLPWSEDLTLTRALAQAEYIGLRDPRVIIVTRDAEAVTLDVNRFLRGLEGDPALLPGDTIELR